MTIMAKLLKIILCLTVFPLIANASLTTQRGGHYLTINYTNAWGDERQLVLNGQDILHIQTEIIVSEKTADGTVLKETIDEESIGTAGNIWTNRNGQSFEGELLSVADNSVTIRRSSDRKKFTMKIADLSEEHQIYLNKLIKDKIYAIHIFLRYHIQAESTISADGIITDELKPVVISIHGITKVERDHALKGLISILPEGELPSGTEILEIISSIKSLDRRLNELDKHLNSADNHLDKVADKILEEIDDLN